MSAAKKTPGEIIRSSEFFNPRYYKKQIRGRDVPDDKLAEDYLRIGHKEGLDPSKKFSTQGYYEQYPDVFKAGMPALLHYERFGRAEGRNTGLPAAGGKSGASYQTRSFSRGIKRMSDKIKYAGLIKKNKDKRILVILHLFYPDSWPEIREYLKNLDVYSYDFIVTYIEGFSEETMKEVKQFKPDTKFVRCVNKGFDLGPFFEAIRNVDLDDYDIVIKLQSKNVTKIRYIYNQFLHTRDWFENLFDGVLRSDVIHRSIDLLGEENRYGIVAAENLIVRDPRHKQHLVKKRLEEFKESGKIRDINYVDNYQYVAGTCFAIRAKLLKRMQALDLHSDDFENTSRGLFSFGHLMERVIAFDIVNQGYEFYGNKVDQKQRAKWGRIEQELYRHSGLRIIEDKRFTIDDDFAYIHLESFMFREPELVPIKLKDIRRERYDHEIVRLDQCEPYLYLNGDKEIYKQYEELHRKLDLLNMTEERFQKLIDSIRKNGYDKRHVIVVDQRNVIMDGQHRACCLLYEYGGDHEIEVLRLEKIVFDFSAVKPYDEHLTEYKGT